jgi:hypothetical protein
MHRILFSHKKDKILSFNATWMKLDTALLSEISQQQQQQQKQVLYGLTHAWNLKQLIKLVTTVLWLAEARQGREERGKTG